MRLDRKLLLIAPTIVLLFVVAGLIYAATQLQLLSSAVGNHSKDRSDFIAAVERGEKQLEPQKAIGLLRLTFDMEAKRTAAIAASRDLIMELSVIALLSCIALVVGIRGVPREHWPRLNLGRSRPE